MSDRPAGPLRRVARRIRRLPTARRIARWLNEQSYHSRHPGGVRDRAIATLLRFDVLTVAERQASIDQLVDRFFDEIEQRPIDVFVEAGAKEGSASVRARTGVGVAHVVAFEANPHTHRRFHHALTSAGVDHRNVALVDAPGPQTFHVRLSDGGRPTADGQSSLLVRPDHEPGYEPTMVRGGLLDQEVRDLSGRVAMWIDVEGATAQVMRGAPETLARTDVVLVEVEDRRMWEGQEWLHLDVIRHLVGHGLRPVARDLQWRYQFNVLFVRNG